MALGAKCDEFRDRAFAEGDIKQGTFWDKRAIHYYTEAKKLSAELAANWCLSRAGRWWQHGLAEATMVEP
jgi:hypothetical protein